ncbi:MAG: DASH family cryptochrome [Bacteroidetes bacterium]|nr:DASH family cryptochrome [Bacteroidota bacterium]
MRRSIIWFKTDLRLHDNETLIEAINHSDEILPVYCFDNSHFNITEFGLKKTGNFRAQFILESLLDLDSKLRKIGSGLLILNGHPKDELLRIASQYGASKVYAKKEVAFEEKRTEAEVEKELWKINCTLETFSTSTLYHAVDLPFSIKDIPDVFTIFRRKVEKESAIRTIFDTPAQIKSPKINHLVLPTLEELGLTKPINDKRKAFNFKGGETEGYARLHYYFSQSKAVSNYKETRNGLVGADYSTKFSAWLAQGCLSPREIYYELKKYESVYGENDSTYWLVFELFWRDYFRFMMKKYRQKLFLQSGIKTWETNLKVHNQEVFEKWINGKTGIDFVDANMQELKLTGFISNRGRQIVASYLVNDLKLDWRYGAAYFEQQLIDYDVCSNWGNWAYLAGVGNDPRGNRYFNIEKQALEYDAKKLYRNLWLNKRIN